MLKSTKSYGTFVGALVLALLILFVYTGLTQTHQTSNVEVQKTYTMKEQLKSPRVNEADKWKGTRDVLLPCGVDDPEDFDREIMDLPEFNATTCDPTSLIDLKKLNDKSWLELADGMTSGRTVCPRKAGRGTNDLPSTGLTSWPGSGNTWTRHLVEQLTGIQTGGVYFERSLVQKGFLGEGKTSGVIGIKSHFTAVQGTRLMHFDRQIVVIRNPFDAIAGNYKRGPMKAGHNKKVDIVPDEEWKQHVRERILGWSYFVRGCLAFRLPQLIVMYEDMKSPCLARELLQMANFLRTDKLTEFSLCCAVSNNVGKSYRNQSRVPIKELYAGQLMDDMNAMLTELAQDVSYKFPVLAERLRSYRVYNDTVL